MKIDERCCCSGGGIWTNVLWRDLMMRIEVDCGGREIARLMQWVGLMKWFRMMLITAVYR